MLDSLEQLRGMRGNYATYEDLVMRCCDIADEIEREVEERYVELPKDADGEYIHIGDRVEDNERVARIVLTDKSWEPSVYIEERPGVLRECFCNEIGHYHEPTVEDVLREFTHAILNQKACYREQNIAEYAAKLQLREERDDGDKEEQ